MRFVRLDRIRWSWAFWKVYIKHWHPQKNRDKPRRIWDILLNPPSSNNFMDSAKRLFSKLFRRMARYF
ncbi:unnamed protein product [Gongylonema pulchrum]|uniref:Uncharacterized protein n=1 Tax=Gongylonema pulchrum TaxID=637853 RepID=A0A183DLS8_9BILA|nr:unnamed protein product [Gongylonema pulchrum]